LNNKSNVIELLDEARALLAGIEQAYVQAKTAESVVVVARPKVKSCLEHLRSALDYIAHDLLEITDPPKRPKRVYFPYGDDAKLYQDSLKRNLPGLDLKYYSALESLQPHACGDDWLIQLCHVTNFNKHIRLENQVRQNSPESTTNLGNLVHGIGPGSQVVFDNCFYNGRPIARSGRLVVTSDKPVAEIERELDAPIPVHREYKWVKFVLTGSGIDVLELLQKSHDRIRGFTDEVYSI
jgi:hypothetical protein